nr:succinate dehydrogenase subunit 3 [Ipomoea batatas]
MLSSDDFLSRNGSFDSLFNAEVFSILICLVYLASLPYVIAAKITFTANTNSSLASSVTGTRWAGIARQFSSKASGNEAAGIDLSTVNSHSSDKENKVTPSVTAAYQKGLFVGMPAKHREFQRAFSTIASDNVTDDGKKVLRPLSPHLPVYTPQTTSTSSILHRISGAYLAGVAFGFHILYLKLGSVCLSYSDFYQFFYYTSKLSELSLEVAAVAMAYHVINGVRHLVADFSGYLFPKIGRKKLK